MTTVPPPAAILIVEDEAVVAWELEECITSLGFRVAGVAASGEEALRCVEGALPDLALVDIHLAGPMDGIELALRLREAFAVPSVIVTANSDEATARRAQPALPSAYLLKPFKPRELKRAVELALFRARAERDLEVSSRLATMKVLASGVAHEINNPLAVVSANVAWASQTIAQFQSTPPTAADVAELGEVLGEAREGIGRITAIVRDLVAFTGRHAPTGEAEVEAAVTWACRATEALWQPVAQLRREVTPGLRAAISEGTLAQVLVQLLSNAAWAIEPATPGPHLIEIRGVADGADHVRVEVRDTGRGLSPKTVQHAFDPFFSGRPVGGGRGLGLSVCHGLVEAAGGTITFDPVQPPTGCCVAVRLRRHDPRQ